METNEIIEYLKTQNIEETDTEKLQTLHNTYLNYILNETGIQIEETKTITDINTKKFNKKNYLINDYPITEIKEIKIDNKTIQQNQYLINLESGIIRWKTPQDGDTLKITYTKTIKTETLQQIENLILNLITYQLTENPDIQTIKEGDVSITYNTNNNLSNKIKEQLENLKNAQNTPTSKMIR